MMKNNGSNGSVDALQQVKDYVRSMMNIPESASQKFAEATSVKEALVAMAGMPGEARSELVEFMAKIAGTDIVVERPLDEVTYSNCSFGQVVLSKVGDIYIDRAHEIPVLEAEADPIPDLIAATTRAEVEKHLRRLPAKERAVIAPIVEQMATRYGS